MPDPTPAPQGPLADGDRDDTHLVAIAPDSTGTTPRERRTARTILALNDAIAEDRDRVDRLVRLVADAIERTPDISVSSKGADEWAAAVDRLRALVADRPEPTSARADDPAVLWREHWRDKAAEPEWVRRLNADPEHQRQMVESEATDWSKVEAVSTEQLGEMVRSAREGDERLVKTCCGPMHPHPSWSPLDPADHFVAPGPETPETDEGEPEPAYVVTTDDSWPHLFRWQCTECDKERGNLQLAASARVQAEQHAATHLRARLAEVTAERDRLSYDLLDARSEAQAEHRVAHDALAERDRLRADALAMDWWTPMERQAARWYAARLSALLDATPTAPTAEGETG